jgi:GNAT superfamily N-acetyltransferase
LAGNYRVIQAEQDHLVAIPGIEHAAATMFSEEDLPRHIRYRVTSSETLQEALRQNRLWIAVTRHDLPVGFAYAAELDGHAHLDEMGVHPDHGRQGVGSKLLMAVCTWAKTHGYSGLSLVTFRHLAWNAPFYRKQGFLQIPNGELSAGLVKRIREEQLAGLDVKKRIAMRLVL